MGPPQSSAATPGRSFGSPTRTSRPSQAPPPPHPFAGHNEAERNPYVSELQLIPQTTCPGSAIRRGFS
jgi:hypothetical protein